MALGRAVLKELLVGLAFAFALGGAVRRAAGRRLAARHARSASRSARSSTRSPATSRTVLAQLYALVGVLIFIAIGGDAWVIQGLARTYDLVAARPTRPALGSLVGGVAARVRRRSSSRRIEVAAPVLLALIITDAAFGVVSRVVPQLNVFAVGFPAKVVVGLLLVGASLPFVAGWIGDELQQRRSPPPSKRSEVAWLMAGEQDREGNTQEARRRRARRARSRKLARPQRRRRAAAPARRAVGSAGPAARPAHGRRDARRRSTLISDARRRHRAGHRRAAHDAVGTATLLAVAPIALVCMRRRRARQRRPGRLQAVARKALKPDFKRLNPQRAQEHLRPERAASRPARTLAKVARRRRRSSRSRCCPKLDRARRRWSACRPRDFGPTARRTIMRHRRSAPPSPTCSSASSTSPGSATAHEKSLKMDKQEVKEEHKQQELPPEVSARMRRRADAGRPRAA